MPKALLFGDLHLHNHKDNVDRLYDCLKTLEWIFEQADKHECDHILFLGDLFHDRAKIDVLNYLRTFEIFTKYMGNSPRYDMYLLIGNHDMYHKERWDVNSVKPLAALPNVTVVDEPCTINIGGRDIDFIPHTENPIFEIEKLKKGRTKGQLSVLLGHMAVNGALLNPFFGTKADVIVEYDTGMEVVDPYMFNDWDRTFLGHYHAAQDLSPTAEYLGSPLELSFGEAFQEKHICILDLDTLEKEYIVNDFSPKHYIISVDEIDQHNLEGSFVRIEVDDISAQDLVDLKIKLVEEKKVASFGCNKIDRKIEQDQADIEESQAVLMKIGDTLKAWIAEKGVPDGLSEEKLLKVGQEVLSESE